MFWPIVAVEASDESDGVAELCAGPDWNMHHELYCSVLSEEAEEPGTCVCVCVCVCVCGRIFRFIWLALVVLDVWTA